MNKLLLPWINKNVLKGYEMSSIEDSISSLEQNPEYIYWPFLSANAYAIDILKKNIDKIQWVNLSGNKNTKVVELLEIYHQEHKKFYYNSFFRSIAFFFFIFKGHDLSERPRDSFLYFLINDVNKDILSQNPSAVPFLEKYPEYIVWCKLSLNKNAISLLEQNLDKIDWTNLSSNENALPLLAKHLDKIDWTILSSNENAISLLEQNLDKIDWIKLSSNKKALPLE